MVLAMSASIGASACSAAGSDGSVSVLGPWIDAEEHAFEQVLQAFTDQTGIQVDYQGTRAFSEVLLANVQGGTPPDIAVLPRPGELADYARRGYLHPLDDVIEDADRAAYSRQWLLPLNVDGEDRTYAVPLKANLKSLVWFNPDNSPQPQPRPRTWDELLEYSRDVVAAGGVPWCMGMGDGPSSGWPGSDMIGSILLHRSGPAEYQKWTAGQLAWTSEAVMEAWTEWGKVAYRPDATRGGASAALFTEFGDAAGPMFADPPGCYLEHQASFITGFYRNFGDDFDFFPFPAFADANDDPARALHAMSADLAGMFHDTRQARRLIGYLATAEAQQIWPSIEGSGAFTVNQNVPIDVHKDEVSKRIATILRSADTLCFDTADLMPANLRNAYYRTVLEYLGAPDEPDDGELETLLRGLDRVRVAVLPEQWLEHLPCPIG
jgi:alpha-glucoside transport system substrate-binding protein